MRPHGEHQEELEFISVEDMAHEDLFVRTNDRHMDSGFVKERLYPLYCADNRRPAVNPVVFGTGAG